MSRAFVMILPKTLPRGGELKEPAFLAISKKCVAQVKLRFVVGARSEAWSVCMHLPKDLLLLVMALYHRHDTCPQMNPAVVFRTMKWALLQILLGRARTNHLCLQSRPCGTGEVNNAHTKTITYTE